jgi:UDP-perosamine 4-acetyltransferase
MNSCDSGPTDSRPVIVLGAGDHAVVVISSLQRLGVKILGAISLDSPGEAEVLGVPVIGSDKEISTWGPTDIMLVNGIGMVAAGQSNRHRSAGKMRKLGFEFRTIVDPTAVTASQVILAEGAQILAGAVVQPRASIGKDSIVNTGTRIDHDCEIGMECHICPGVTLAGGVKVGRGTMIGAGTTVIPGITIGADSLIAAGSVVFVDVPPESHFIQRRETTS